MRRRKLQVQISPEFMHSRARRDAAGVGAFGWRPTAHELANLRASTRNPFAYREMLRAWVRSAGFSIAAVRRLARRKPKPARAPLAATARAEIPPAATHAINEVTNYD